MLVLLRLGAQAAARAGAARSPGEGLARAPAVAFAGSRRALRHVAGDPGLGELVCRAVCRKERGDLDQIDDDQKDDVAARFDGLWPWYALRYSIRPSNAEALVETRAARRAGRDQLHWRHRLVADVVLGHALAARDQDDGDDETWQYVAQGATDPQDAPTQRARLAVALRFSDRAARGGVGQGAAGSRKARLRGRRHGARPAARAAGR